MSQSDNGIFGHEPVNNSRHTPEWWENSDAFASTSVPRSTKIQDRHDVESKITITSKKQTEEYFNGRNSVQSEQKSKSSKTNKRKKNEKQQVNSEKNTWLLRNGHSISYIGLFLFTLTVYFRPYELIPALSGFTSMALVLALLTLVVFLPTQIGLEGTFTARPSEVNMVLIMMLCGLITIPIAKDPALAWQTFNDSFIKAILMFIVMVNVIRTEYRLKGIMWLSIAVGVWLSLNALEDYRIGHFTIEGYRIEGEIGGMFSNPNDMALHLVTMMPITIALLINSDNILTKAVYGFCFVALVAGNLVTFSRGGFIGMMVCLSVLMWKLGKKKRGVVAIFGVLFLGMILILAPGNYSVRILSIFIPGLDPVGSSDHRSLLLQQSILVTLRNPWGIGMGNFTIVSNRSLVTHNAYTEVSSELGVIALIAYIAFMVKPLRRLRGIEKETFDSKESSKFYYLSVGLQAGLIGYMVGSFFASVAYLWFVYYLVAYAIALRRIYLLAQNEKSEMANETKTAGALARSRLSKVTT